MESPKRCFIPVPLLSNELREEFLKRLVSNMPSYSKIKLMRENDKIQGIPTHTIGGPIVEIEWIITKNWLYYESGNSILLKCSSKMETHTFSIIKDVVSKSLADVIRSKYYVEINKSISQLKDN